MPIEQVKTGRLFSERIIAWEYPLLVAVIAIVWLIIWVQIGGFSELVNAPLRSWFYGDIPYVLAWSKSYVDGGLIHFPLSINSFLNAPYVANWNDFPGEDVSSVIAGQLSKVFGLFLGSNIFILLVHIMCGVVFYFVGRTFNYQRCWNWMGAIVFAFAPMIFYRSLGHMSLATIWYLPLMIFTLVWINHPDKINLSEKLSWRLCLATSIIAGCSNIYYTALFAFILGFNWIIRLVRKDRSSQKIAILIMVILCAAFVQHFNHFLFIWQEGRNHSAIVRDLATLLFASMTIPDLIFSPAHQGSALNFLFPFAKNYYGFFPDYLNTESRVSFIGTTAACGLFILYAKSIVSIFEKKWAQINHWFWLSLGIFAFSITGGLNFLFGSLGYLLIRSNNRFSVFLMLIGLYYLCELLSKKTHFRHSWVIALLIACFAVWDQIPSQDSALKNTLSAQSLDSIQSNKAAVAELESKLPLASMVFQLPVHPFPEAGAKEKMGDYEQFIPYLYSQALRFSYGSNKGRGDTHWQTVIAKESIDSTISKLESYGFSALLIHKNGYEDNARALITTLQSQKYAVITENATLIAFRLNPSKTPISPAPDWQISNTSGLEQYESDIPFRWTLKGNEMAFQIQKPWYIRLDPNSPYQAARPLVLDFQSPVACSISYRLNQGPLNEIALLANKSARLSVELNGDKKNQLLLKTNCPKNEVRAAQEPDAFLTMSQPTN